MNEGVADHGGAGRSRIPCEAEKWRTAKDILGSRASHEATVLPCLATHCRSVDSERSGGW